MNQETQRPTVFHSSHVDPFAIYQHHLVEAIPRPVGWLWQDRLPLAGMTLLDGDHGCGKSLLAMTLAAHVSSAAPMPDGTPTMKAGVVIVSPHTDATSSQFAFLSSQGADLSRIEILSYIHDPETSSHPSGYRPFSLPQDLPRLWEAVERVNAGLVILDPFIDLLSHDQRWTDQSLGHLLAEFNQHLMARNIACLLIRNCPAKGGHARPSALERSERFLSLAVSRLLLAPDPMEPDRLLLAHAKSSHTALSPTLSLHIQSRSHDSSLACITFEGTHSVMANDLLSLRPDALHRRLLFQHLREIIAVAPHPIPIATLYACSSHSSPSQIQRCLKDLLNMGQVERPARGFYALAPADPVFAGSASHDKSRDADAKAQEMLQDLLDEVKDETFQVWLKETIRYDDNTLPVRRKLAHLMRLLDKPQQLPSLEHTPEYTPSLDEAPAITPILELTPALDPTAASAPASGQTPVLSPSAPSQRRRFPSVTTETVERIGEVGWLEISLDNSYPFPDAYQRIIT